MLTPPPFLVADLKLFINTSNNSLVAGQSSTQSVDPSSLPLFFGDVLTLKIYLLQTPVGYNAVDPSNSRLETVSPEGLQLFFYIDDGKIAATIYTQQIAFDFDPAGFFYGTLALNTQKLSDLISAGTSAQAWIKVGYVQGGQQTTVLSKQVSIRVGMPVGALEVPAGQTPLSAEVANATFYPLNPPNGLPLPLVSAAGKKALLTLVDNPDGTVQLQVMQLN